MNRIIFFIGILLFFFACSNDEIKQEDLAAQAAKAYYDQLINGDYKSFVAGTDGFQDSIPANYREQLETNMKQYIARQKKLHEGIDSVTAVRAKVDTIKAEKGTCIVANAFLSISYSDKTKEEIVVPMVKKNDLWLMR